MNGKILIVDDEQVSQDLIEHIINADFPDAQVEKVSSASEAMASLKNGNQADVVIADINMPEVSGFDLYSAIKSENIDTKVVFVTATDKKFLGHKLTNIVYKGNEFQKELSSMVWLFINTIKLMENVLQINKSLEIHYAGR